MKTILVRPGNKRAIAERIIAHFPAHEVYIEPFFGAGGLFFEKPKAKKNIVNDLDAEVFNLFQVVQHQPAKLRQAIKTTPHHEAQLQYWKQHRETDPLKRAMRFLFLSNYTFMGKGQTLKIDPENARKLMLERITPTMKFLEGVSFASRDFRSFFKQIPQRTLEKPTLIYCDPPYLDTDSKTYKTGQHWSSNDLEDLIKCCKASKAKFAISEFDTEAVLKLAKKYKLRTIPIGERQNLQNRRTEILMTNY